MKYNILLVIVDALRQDALKVAMPFLNKFAMRCCYVFTDAYSTTNATDPAITSILSGLYPASHGITEHGEKV